MTIATAYDPDPTTACRLFNLYDSIRNKEVPIVPAFQNMAETFLSGNRITQTRGKVIVKMGFTANLLTDSIFFFMDFDNKGVEFYEAAQAYFRELGFEGSLKPAVEPDTISISFQAATVEKLVYYRMGYICLNNDNVRPLVAFDFKG